MLSSASAMGKEEIADGSPATACNPAIVPHITVSETPPSGETGPEFVSMFVDDTVVEVLDVHFVTGT